MGFCWFEQQRDRICLQFSAGFASELVAAAWAHLLDLDAPSVLYAKPEQSEALLEIVEKLEHEYEHDELGRANALRAYFEILLIELIRYRSGSAAAKILSPAAKLIEKFRALVDEHFQRRLSVQNYALMLEVSESHLSHTVRKHTGMTAGWFIQERVLLEAKRLLVHCEANISNIASELGFNDPAYFSRLFKKHTARSPRAFKSEFENSCRPATRLSTTDKSFRRLTEKYK